MKKTNVDLLIKEMKESKKHYFQFNSLWGMKKEPLDLEDFMNDLAEVMKKHEIKSFEGGRIVYVKKTRKVGMQGVSIRFKNFNKKEIKPLTISFKQSEEKEG